MFLFLRNDVLSLFLVGQEVAKKSYVFFFEISFSDMCNLYNIHQASDCHKGFINILSFFLWDESGPEPPIHFPKSPFSVKGRWQG